jgi:hypothetical protein
MSPLITFLIFSVPAYALGLGTRELAGALIALYAHHQEKPMPHVHRGRLDRLLHRANSPRFIIPLLGVLAVIASGALVVSLTSRGQVIDRVEHLTTCLANFNEYDSKARQVRADASARQSKALRDAVVSAGKILDPTVDVSPADLTKARFDLAAFVTAADEYDSSIEAYPYRTYRSFCGGER